MPAIRRTDFPNPGLYDPFFPCEFGRQRVKGTRRQILGTRWRACTSALSEPRGLSGERRGRDRSVPVRRCPSGHYDSFDTTGGNSSATGVRKWSISTGRKRGAFRTLLMRILDSEHFCSFSAPILVSRIITTGIGSGFSAVTQHRSSPFSYPVARLVTISGCLVASDTDPQRRETRFLLDRVPLGPGQ